MPLHHLTKLPYGRIERMPRQEEGRTPAGGRAERITWGVLFVTYSALVGSNRSGQSRLEQAGVASSQPVQSVTTTLLPTEAMLSTIATLLLATLPVRMVVAHGGHTAVRERGEVYCRAELWQAKQPVPVDVGELPQLPSARGVGGV